MRRPIPLDNPEYCSGCYDLDLYCDHANPEHGWDEFPHSITGESGAYCRKVARRAGWKLHSDGTATCPKCVKALRRTPTDAKET